MSAGFTPGPWARFGDTLIDNRGQYVAVMHERSLRRAEDARLIAAAPMLFDACEDALEALKLLVAGLSHNRAMIDMINPHIDELEYATRKARGDLVDPLEQVKP